MRRLLSNGRDVEVGEALLQVFQRFDDMLIEGAGLQSLTAAAAELVGAEVFVLDLLNGRCVGASELGPAAGDAAIGHAILRAVNAEGPGTREVERHDLGGASVVAASLEHGRGRLGVVWTPKPESEWTDSHELAIERFASAASIAIQQDRRSGASRWQGGDMSALELLVAGGLDEIATEEAIRAARLSADRRYVVIALSLDPPGVVSDAVATAAVGRVLDSRGAVWRAVTVLNAPLIVSTSEGADESALSSAVADVARSGWRLMIGVGDAVHPGELSQSAVQSREALVLGISGDGSGVSSFSSLGALHLLACIPKAALDQNPDLAVVTALADSRSGASDLALLVAYCETGSLRKTGERMYLHHSSVEYRVRRLEAALGFTLNTPPGRFRALLAATIARISRAADLS